MLCCTRFYVRDGALIGDLRDSLQPMIWRMELARVHAVGFRVQQDGSTWHLGMEGSAGTFTPITSYASEAAAKKALAGISNGLRRQGWMRRTFQAVMLALMLLLGSYVFYNFGLSLLSPDQTQENVSLPSVLLPQVAQPTGQALSADQALRAPPPLPR